MNERFDKLNLGNLVAKLLSSVSDKNREILERRFGIGRNEAETLESIGKSYKITRERVRQIQEYGLKKLVASGAETSLAPAFDKILKYINSRGGVAREADIFNGLARPKDASCLAFVLRLMPGLVVGRETDDLHARYAIDEGGLRKADSLVSRIHNALSANNAPVPFPKLLLLAKQEAQNFSEKSEDISDLPIENVLSLSKRIKRGPFGEYGLAEWPKISPRGVRDKAYIVFEQEKKPLHFRDISKLIDKYFVSSTAVSTAKLTHPQTVHNELIKDPRFVLIGRGLYALSEWGYEPGTVKDVLVQIFRESGQALHKEDVLKSISERRFVKPNTVFLNLQNKNYFKKLDDGRYYLA